MVFQKAGKQKKKIESYYWKRRDEKKDEPGENYQERRRESEEMLWKKQKGKWEVWKREMKNDVSLNGEKDK